jgi:hypothetical protein
MLACTTRFLKLDLGEEASLVNLDLTWEARVKVWANVIEDDIAVGLDICEIVTGCD